MKIDEMVYAAGLRQAWHTHDYASLSYIVRGDVLETSVEGRGRASVGDVIVKPAGVAHDDEYGGRGARMFTLIADEDLGAYRLLFGGPPSALFLRMIAEWQARADYGEIAVDLLASVAGGSLRSCRSSTLYELAMRVATTDDSVEQLAREHSMHPVALARAFRREHGCSITAYRRRARVRRAVALLVDGAALVDVALESGFSDQSHLCRVFRTEMGTTPARFRALAV